MTDEETRTKIREVLAAHAKLSVDVAGLSDDADLFAVGFASVASVNVMLGIEDAFDIEFPDAMLTRNAFRSVDAIAAAVETISTPA